MSNQYSDETSAAITAMIAAQPFFATYMALRMNIIEDDVTPTASTDGTNIKLGPWFRKKITPQQRVFVLCHEVLHAVLMHCQRARMYKDINSGPDGKPLDFTRWNVAADYIINDTLIQSKVGLPVEGMLHDTSIATYEDMVDDIYKKLPETPQDDGDGDQPGEKPGPGPGPGQGQGGKPCKPGQGKGKGKGEQGSFDDHELAPEPMTETAEAANKQAITQAANAAKTAGKMPGALRDFVNNVLKGKLAWQDLLRRRMQATARSGDNDWSRPNRRKLAFSAVTAIDLPIYASHKADNCGIIVVQIDTSGSISEREVCAFLAEIKLIIEDCQPTELYVLWTDARVAKVDHLEQCEGDIAEALNTVIDRIAKEGVPGGGGTNMCKGFEYVDKWGIDADTMVTFTDGCTPWPAEKPAFYHLAVVTEKTGVAKAGKVGDAVFLDTDAN